MFLFKKILAPFFLPLSLCLGFLLIGLVLLWFTKKQKSGKMLVSFCAFFLLLSSYTPFSDLIVRPLENRYQPLTSFDSLSQVKWIVILGSGHVSDVKLPVTDQISPISLARLVEGIRIHRNLPSSKLVFLGGKFLDPVPNAIIMKNVAVELGINEKNLVIEPYAKDTMDEVVLAEKIVKNDPFILVTSASHMPRSKALFHKKGMHPIPAPTDYIAKEMQGLSIDRYFPNAAGIKTIEVAMHEYMGLIWAALRGQI